MVFNTLWRAISHFIDPVTKQKVRRSIGLLCRYWVALSATARRAATRSRRISELATWTATPSLTPTHPPRYPIQIHFVNYNKKGDNSKLETLLARYFDGHTCSWLLREMGDNRDKGLALSKAYSYPCLRRVLCQCLWGGDGGQPGQGAGSVQGRRATPASGARGAYIGGGVGAGFSAA